MGSPFSTAIKMDIIETMKTNPTKVAPAPPSAPPPTPPVANTNELSPSKPPCEKNSPRNIVEE